MLRMVTTRDAIMRFAYRHYVDQDCPPPWPGARHRDAFSPLPELQREVEYLANTGLLEALDNMYYRISAMGINHVEEQLC